MRNSTGPTFETTLHVRDTCLCMHTQRAARAIARRFDVALKPVGITSGQFSLLMSLNRPKATNLASVASLLGMDRTTVTANLKPLERHNLVTTAPDPNDGRAKLLQLTPAGRNVLAKAVPSGEVSTLRSKQRSPILITRGSSLIGSRHQTERLAKAS
jgi:DNA-binding MarR family transcriptional regulator